MQLTPHFSLGEMTFSRTAVMNGINNTPDAATIANLKELAKLLETIRTDMNRPLVVTSGYRSPKLNMAVGGAQESAHLTGRAADIYAPGMTIKALMDVIARRGYPFDKLIMEYDNWVHIQIPKPGAKPRQEIYTIRKGTGYMAGIV